MLSIEAEKKALFLRYLVNSGDWSQILIFVSSIRTADMRDQIEIKNGGGWRCLSMGIKAKGTYRSFKGKKFKSGKPDLSSNRPLQDEELTIKISYPLVINYELPRSPKRIMSSNRSTGRAARNGWSKFPLIYRGRCFINFKIIPKEKWASKYSWEARMSLSSKRCIDWSQRIIPWDISKLRNVSPNS